MALSGRRDDDVVVVVVIIDVARPEAESDAVGGEGRVCALLGRVREGGRSMLASDRRRKDGTGRCDQDLLVQKHVSDASRVFHVIRDDLNQAGTRKVGPALHTTTFGGGGLDQGDHTAF